MAAETLFLAGVAVVNGPRTVTARRRVVGALTWGVLVSAGGMVLAMAAGAYLTRLDPHGLGFLGAIGALFAFVPGGWLGWRLAHRPFYFWIGVALVFAGILAANLWKLSG